MAKKYGIQLRGLGRALKPRGPGVLRPKPTDRYGQQMKPKPIRPGKKDGGKIGVKEGKSKPKNFPKEKPKDLIYAPKKMERLKQLREELGMKKGGKAKFPDLTGDGKVTRADILKGRGVFAAGGQAKGVAKDLKELRKKGIKTTTPELLEKLNRKNRKGKNNG